MLPEVERGADKNHLQRATGWDSNHRAPRWNLWTDGPEHGEADKSVKTPIKAMRENNTETKINVGLVLHKLKLPCAFETAIENLHETVFCHFFFFLFYETANYTFLFCMISIQIMPICDFKFTWHCLTINYFFLLSSTLFPLASFKIHDYILGFGSFKISSLPLDYTHTPLINQSGYWRNSECRHW